jgi:hypothetical protein
MCYYLHLYFLPIQHHAWLGPTGGARISPLVRNDFFAYALPSLIINGSKFENKGRVSELDLESSSGQDSAGCN